MASGSAHVHLVRTMFLAIALASAVAAMALVLVARTDWWRGLIAAGVISTLAASVSLVPLLVGFRRGIYGAVAGYFTGAALRLVISLGGCVLAIFVGHYPRVPTLLLMLFYYVVILAVESTVMSRWLWSSQANSPAVASKP